jgi:hypothetical protein
MSPVYVVVTWVAFVAISFARPSAADTYSSAQLHGLRHIKVAVSMWDRSEAPAFEPGGEWEQFERNARLKVGALLEQEGFAVTPVERYHGPVEGAFEVLVRLADRRMEAAQAFYAFSVVAVYRESVVLKRDRRVSAPDGGITWLRHEVIIAPKSELQANLLEQILEMAESFRDALLFENGRDLEVHRRRAP